MIAKERDDAKDLEKTTTIPFLRKKAAKNGKNTAENSAMKKMILFPKKKTAKNGGNTAENSVKKKTVMVRKILNLVKRNVEVNGENGERNNAKILNLERKNAENGENGEKNTATKTLNLEKKNAGNGENGDKKTLKKDQKEDLTAEEVAGEDPEVDMLGNTLRTPTLILWKRLGLWRRSKKRLTP